MKIPNPKYNPKTGKVVYPITPHYNEMRKTATFSNNGENAIYQDLTNQKGLDAGIKCLLADNKDFELK